MAVRICNGHLKAYAKIQEFINRTR